VQSAIVYTTFVVGFFNYTLPVVLGLDEEEDGAAKSRHERDLSRHGREGKGEEEPTAQAGEEQDQEGENDEEDPGRYETAHEVGEEDSVFIPLGWARQCPQRFYRGSDPEWQEFVKFANDPKRAEKVRHDLAGMVGDFVTQNKGFRRVLGQKCNIGRYWLDIDFPDGPPPEYERGGIEVTPDYIAWTVKPVTPRNYFRLHQALWPSRYPLLSGLATLSWFRSRSRNLSHY